MGVLAYGDKAPWTPDHDPPLHDGAWPENLRQMEADITAMSKNGTSDADMLPLRDQVRGRATWP
jgi:hypothetical protein